MYHAALTGRKCQTRRILALNDGLGGLPAPGPCVMYTPSVIDQHGYEVPAKNDVYGVYTEDAGWHATYGAQGRRVPIVATWAVAREWDTVRPCVMDPDVVGGSLWFDDGTPKPDWAGRSRPAMFFPTHLYSLARQAEIVSAKVEFVQDISYTDAVDEGIEQHPTECRWLDYGFEAQRGTSTARGWFDSSRKSFRSLWDSINAKRGKGATMGLYAWAANPMVCATTFRVLPQ